MLKENQDDYLEFDRKPNPQSPNMRDYLNMVSTPCPNPLHLLKVMKENEELEGKNQKIHELDGLILKKEKIIVSTKRQYNDLKTDITKVLSL